MVGARDTSSCKKLYNKIKNKFATYYTDRLDCYDYVLPESRHVKSKKDTIAIEQENSNTRHRLARFTRKTKAISRSPEMIDLALKLNYALENTEIFQKYQNDLLSIFM